MDRLKEPSTWVGVLTLACLVGGVGIAPDRIAEIAGALATVAGAVLIVIRER